MLVLPSDRNQSVDLHSKSIDWFLDDGNIGISWVKPYLDYGKIIYCQVTYVSFPFNENIKVFYMI